MDFWPDLRFCPRRKNGRFSVPALRFASVRVIFWWPGPSDQIQKVLKAPCLSRHDYCKWKTNCLDKIKASLETLSEEFYHPSLRDDIPNQNGGSFGNLRNSLWPLSWGGIRGNKRRTFPKNHPVWFGRSSLNAVIMKFNIALKHSTPASPASPVPAFLPLASLFPSQGFHPLLAFQLHPSKF